MYHSREHSCGENAHQQETDGGTERKNGAKQPYHRSCNLKHHETQELSFIETFLSPSFVLRFIKVDGQDTTVKTVVYGLPTAGPRDPLDMPRQTPDELPAPALRKHRVRTCHSSANNRSDPSVHYRKNAKQLTPSNISATFATNGRLFWF